MQAVAGDGTDDPERGNGQYEGHTNSDTTQTKHDAVGRINGTAICSHHDQP